MKNLHRTIKEYLQVRRSLGYKLQEYERPLLSFATFLTQAKSSFITQQLALTWATGVASNSAKTAARRLGVIRGFAKFAHALDPRNEVPPPECLPYSKTRPLPYLYSEADVRALMEGIQTLPMSPFKRSTYSTLFGLLAATGMRVGEAIALDRTDFDRHDGVLTIRCGKFGKSREIPLHATTQAVLRQYEHNRDRFVPQLKCPAFFLSKKSNRLLRQNVSTTFWGVLRLAGLWDRKPRRPRIHDLRHSFAVRTLCDWYCSGLDVEAQIPLLSTYLGHVNPSSTYWYLTAVPELVGLAAQRLERAMGDLP